MWLEARRRGEGAETGFTAETLRTLRRTLRGAGWSGAAG